MILIELLNQKQLVASWLPSCWTVWHLAQRFSFSEGDFILLKIGDWVMRLSALWLVGFFCKTAESVVSWWVGGGVFLLSKTVTETKNNRLQHDPDLTPLCVQERRRLHRPGGAENHAGVHRRVHHWGWHRRADEGRRQKQRWKNWLWWCVLQDSVLGSPSCSCVHAQAFMTYFVFDRIPGVHERCWVKVLLVWLHHQISSCFTGSDLHTPPPPPPPLTNLSPSGGQ